MKKKHEKEPEGSKQQLAIANKKFGLLHLIKYTTALQNELAAHRGLEAQQPLRKDNNINDTTKQLEVL